MQNSLNSNRQWLRNDVTTFVKENHFKKNKKWVSFHSSATRPSSAMCWWGWARRDLCLLVSLADGREIWHGLVLLLLPRLKVQHAVHCHGILLTADAEKKRFIWIPAVFSVSSSPLFLLWFLLSSKAQISWFFFFFSLSPTIKLGGQALSPI